MSVGLENSALDSVPAEAKRLPRHVVVTGSSGLVGTRLRASLREAGCTVVPLRHGKQGDPDAEWNPATGWIEHRRLEGADAIVHLAGASIADGRWTDERKRVLWDSRIDGTRLLVDALTRLERPPKVLVSASAVGYYGDRDDQKLDEDAEPGSGFLAELCVQWEAEARRAETLGLRVAMVRTGLVMSGKGGLLPRMVTPFRMGLGAKLGSGEQWMSWIGLDDLVRIYVALLQNELEGPFNACAPAPVRNAEFTDALADALNRFAVLSIPDFVLDVAAGPERAEELLLASQRAVPRRLQEAGFNFEAPSIHKGLRRALGGEG